jgi:hypothetical protein
MCEKISTILRFGKGGIGHGRQSALAGNKEGYPVGEEGDR